VTTEPHPYEDDPTIEDHAELWRRIPSQFFVEDQNQGGWRPSSQAFQNLNKIAMSVTLADLVRESGQDAASILAGFDGYGLALVTAGLARSLDQGVRRDPTADEPAHAEVFGEKTKKVRKAFAKAATWVINPK